MLALAILAAAGASEIAPQWSDATVRYHAEAFVKHFHPVELLGVQNHNVRTTTLLVAAQLECGGSAVKKGTALRCDIDDIALEGEPLHADQQDALAAVLQDYDALLTGARVEVLLGADGRIRRLDLEGVARNDDRMAAIHETLRLLMRRVLAPLDQQLPRGGAATTGDDWRHKSSPVAFELFRRTNMVGGSVLEYAVLSDDGAEVLIQAEGHGNVGLTGVDPSASRVETSPNEPELQRGNAMPFGGSSGFAAGGSSEVSTGTSSGSMMYSVLARTRARYDVSAGQWAYLESTAQGQRNQGDDVDGYTQAAWMGRINDDGTIEDVGALEGDEAAGG